jgi:AcrR family transcriptional regulator
MPSKSAQPQPPEKSPRKPRPAVHLERDKVLDATLDLLNEVGFDGLTLRCVADRLGVKAAALYWHFENKQDLINQLAARIFTREFDTSKAELDKFTWREILTGMGQGFCSALMRYRDGAMLIARADMSRTSGGFKGRELVIEALIKKGLPGPVIFTAMFSVVRYTLGYVFEEQADPRAEKKGQAYMRDEELGKNPRYQFEQGLELILDGIEKKLTAK